MPAHDPKAGRPAARRARSGSSTPNSRASLIIVVDSPPGSTMPSTAVQFGRSAHGPGLRADRAQRGQVLTHIALEGENADAWNGARCAQGTKFQ